MIEGGEHLQYVYWAYAGVAVATVCLVAWVLWQSRRVKAELAVLEAQGISRGKGGPAA
jgi:heme exporter protein CcmD